MDQEVKQVPSEIQDLIDRYKNLDFGGIKVQTPYYINIKRARGELRSLVGKGSPEEIIEETQIYARLRSFNLKTSTPDQIREFMQTQGIGIDCSGFVAHILNEWLKIRGSGRLVNKIDFGKINPFKRLRIQMRAIENIGANTMTGELNADPVSLKEIQIGDLIRMKGLKGGHHIVIVTKVELDSESKQPTAFEYTQSTTHYGRDNGVKTGRVEITDLAAELKDQNWIELDGNGECPSLKQLLKGYEDNGLRRLKFHEELV